MSYAHRQVAPHLWARALLNPPTLRGARSGQIANDSSSSFCVKNGATTSQTGRGTTSKGEPNSGKQGGPTFQGGANDMGGVRSNWRERWIAFNFSGHSFFPRDFRVTGQISKPGHSISPQGDGSLSNSHENTLNPIFFHVHCSLQWSFPLKFHFALHYFFLYFPFTFLSLCPPISIPTTIPLP